VAAAALVSASPANAGPYHHHHRVLHVTRMIGPPAHIRAGYVGAPGFAGGPPGPVVPMLIDFAPSGFFSPAGFIDYDTALVTGVVGGVPGLVTGAVDLGTGVAGAAVGAGTGIVGTGVGYVAPRS
jgi:hypothetical protein